MQSEQTFTWEQKPTRELLRLAWPIAGSMLSWALMSLVDTLFVSQLGTAELAGVGLGGIVVFAFMCFPQGVLLSVKILVSQAVGAGRNDQLGVHLASGIFFALLLGTLCLAVGTGLVGFVSAAAATPAAGGFAQDYMSIRLLGVPLWLLSWTLREFCYGRGNSRVPLVATGLANAANIGLDALFIIGFSWGVEGAAWATVIGRLFELLVMIWLVRRAGVPRVRLSWPAVRQMWRLGLPTGVQFLLEMGSFAALSIMISTLSEVEMSAHQIALNIILVSFLPAVAIGEAASILTGNAVGADRDDLVPVIAKTALWVAAVYTGFFTLVFGLGASWIAATFIREAEVVRIATRLLYVAALFQIVDAAYAVARSVLRGAADLTFSATVGVVTAWVVTPPLMWLLGYRFGLGALGGWIGLSFEILLAAVILWWRIQKGAWKKFAARSRARIRNDQQQAPHSQPTKIEQTRDAA